MQCILVFWKTWFLRNNYGHTVHRLQTLTRKMCLSFERFDFLCSHTHTLEKRRWSYMHTHTPFWNVMVWLLTPLFKMSCDLHSIVNQEWNNINTELFRIESLKCSVFENVIWICLDMVLHDMLARWNIPDILYLSSSCNRPISSHQTELQNYIVINCSSFYLQTIKLKSVPEC